MILKWFLSHFYRRKEQNRWLRGTTGFYSKIRRSSKGAPGENGKSRSKYCRPNSHNVYHPAASMCRHYPRTFLNHQSSLLLYCKYGIHIRILLLSILANSCDESIVLAFQVIQAVPDARSIVYLLHKILNWGEKRTHNKDTTKAIMMVIIKTCWIFISSNSLARYVLTVPRFSRHRQILCAVNRGFFSTMPVNSIKYLLAGPVALPVVRIYSRSVWFGLTSTPDTFCTSWRTMRYQ